MIKAIKLNVHREKKTQFIAQYLYNITLIKNGGFMPSNWKAYIK